MTDSRIDLFWDLASAMLSQIANMRTWVFRTDAKFHTAKEWNPRFTTNDPDRPKAKPVEVPQCVRDEMWKSLAKANKR